MSKKDDDRIVNNMYDHIEKEAPKLTSEQLQEQLKHSRKALRDFRRLAKKYPHWKDLPVEQWVGYRIHHKVIETVKRLVTTQERKNYVS